MKVIFDWRGFPAERRGGVLCVGNFDGVHVGHRRMLERGREEARRRGVSFTVMTFDPHPGVVLRPEVVRRPLTTMGQREDLLRGIGVDVLIVVKTDREFLSMTAEDFLGGVVRDVIGAKVMVEGASFTFGRGAKGTVGTLLERGKEFGIEVVVVETAEVALTDLSWVRVSSSLIRWLVENGRVADAEKCLGRAYALRGEVVHGEKRGRTIGFPTANVSAVQLLPGMGVGGGVFAGWAVVEGVRHLAAISVGTNPTFHATPLPGALVTVEAYLLDFEGDLYGKVVELEFVRWVREMEKFGGVEALVRAIGKDVDKTRLVMTKIE